MEAVKTSCACKGIVLFLSIPFDSSHLLSNADILLLSTLSTLPSLSAMSSRYTKWLHLLEPVHCFWSQKDVFWFLHPSSFSPNEWSAYKITSEYNIPKSWTSLVDPSLALWTGHSIPFLHCFSISVELAVQHPPSNPPNDLMMICHPPNDMPIFRGVLHDLVTKNF